MLRSLKIIAVQGISVLLLLSPAELFAQMEVRLIDGGVKNWNRWRQQNPGISVDLSGANLSGANLRKANLSEADLRKANLNGVEGLTQEQIASAIIGEETKLP